jgi:hypothetical protein
LIEERKEKLEVYLEKISLIPFLSVQPIVGEIFCLN